MGNITGLVRADPPGGSFAGHRVLFTFQLAADPASRTSSARPGVASAPVGDGGQFEVRLPDPAAVDGDHAVEAAVLSPTGVVLSRRTLSADELGSPVELTAAPASGFVVRPSDDPTLGQLRRLTGRVIDRSGAAVPAGVPVVLWGVDADVPGAPARPLVAVDTQTGGYFGGPWPDQRLATAYGLVRGTARATIALADGHLPTRVILVVDDVGEVDPCDCGVVPPRTPGQADLVGNPAAFSQDLGGTCVDLTMPNRVLEEYSHVLVVRTTEPDVRPVGLGPPTPVPHRLLQALTAIVAAPSARALAQEDGPRTTTSVADAVVAERAAGDRTDFTSALDAGTVRELLARPEGVSVDTLQDSALTAASREALRLVDLIGPASPVRTELDGVDAVSWDASPTVFEAVTVAIGHVLHFRQVWRADGYSLGDLVHSIPLAPGEKRQIAVLDWERRTTAGRTEDLESEEAFAAVAERDRDINEIAGSHLDERSDAGSDSSTWAAGGASAPASSAAHSGSSAAWPAGRAGRTPPAGRTRPARWPPARCSSCGTGPPSGRLPPATSARRWCRRWPRTRPSRRRPR